ncbi:DUF6207 family protein [Streptomyces sp. NPDC052052]|uniref:DUF6207 family protein n=1 Tax=Streptomyces sp. NPDC052052 TaxID=3154756 RepID=UPI00342B07BF
MRPIDAVHVSEPGLVVVEVVAGDEETALAAVAELGEWWATSGPSAPWRARRTRGTGTDVRAHPHPCVLRRGAAVG